MKNLIFLILAFTIGAHAEIPISQFPLTSDPGTIGNQDSFPYVQKTITNSTRRMYVKDIVGIPSFVNKFALYAPLADPIFTGTVTAPTFSGNLIGNSTNVTGIVQINHGGTGASVRDLAITNLLPSQVGLNTYSVLSSVGGSAAWVSGVLSVNGYQNNVVLVKSDVGLGNVDNTSDATKNITAATLQNKTLLSPVIITPTMSGDVTSGRYVSSTIISPTVSGGNFTGASMDATVATNGTYTNPSLLGSPTATTAASSDSSTRIATTAFVKTHVPITTKGDLLTRDASGSIRLPVGANGTTLVADSTTAAGIKWAANSAGGAPEVFLFNGAGSGTYTVGVGTVWIRVRMVGAGGGGGSGASAGSTGGNTTFGSGTSVAFGGQGGSATGCVGVNGTLCRGGSGGSISISTPGAVVVSYSQGGAGGGGGGFNSFNNNWGGSAGVGGNSCMGGGAPADTGAQGGAFGGGGGGSSPNPGGGGGGGGGCGEFIIKAANLSSSYSYTVGAAGGGPASSGGGGLLVIEEYH